MAFTISTEKTVLGNKRVHLLSCSVDSVSGNIDTGLSVVDHVAICPVSMNSTSIAMRIKKNIGSGATALPGIININSATAGDVFFLTVYGK